MVLDQQPNVFGQELNPRQVSTMAREHGYHVFWPPTVKPNWWIASWVMVRDDLQPRPVPQELLAPFDSYVAAGRINWPGLGDLTVVSMHASPKPVPAGQLDRWPWTLPQPRVGQPGRRGLTLHYSDLIVEMLRLLADDGPLLAAGDLNEARAWDDVNPGHTFPTTHPCGSRSAPLFHPVRPPPDMITVGD